MLGGAPDTFLGAGIQTCRKLIDDGFIGDPVGAAAFMICRGHESWHPDPEFYYKRGGGPDAGHGTVLRHGAGQPAGRRAQASWAAPRPPSRTAPSPAQPKRGTDITVDVADLRHRHHGL